MSYSVLPEVRVLDLGIITAGASTSAILADLGAEVIKVEGPNYIDPFRVWSVSNDYGEWWNTSPHFLFTNRNKKGLCIDLKTEAGREVLLRLVAHSDVVVENFRTGVLDGLGLGFEVLSQRKPDIILASVSSQGVSGPLADAVSFGSTLEGSSGLASLMLLDDVPQISGQALNYPDQVASLFAAGAILAALVERKRTGQGAHLDISQREVATFLIGEFLSDQGSPQTAAPGAPAVLQTIVQTLDQRWLAVTVATPKDAEAVRNATGQSELDLKDWLPKWIAETRADAAIACLRGAGAAVAIVATRGELGGADNTSYQNGAVARDSEGNLVKGLPWIIGEQPLRRFSRAPSLGADNEMLVRKRLGLSRQEYEALSSEGILATSPRQA